ncbi:MAG: DNA polymerase III subunit alpha [Acholeplasmataceae bacterium]
MSGVLYLQSAYSMLKNTIPLDRLVTHAKDKGYDFVALTDDNLHGLLQFHEMTRKHHIKPVYGIHVKTNDPLEQTGFLIYVKDHKGYQNLLKIAFEYSKNTLTFECLKDHQEGLIFVNSGADDHITTSLLAHDNDMAKSHIKRYQASFDDFYIGLCLDTFDLEMKVAPELKVIANQFKIEMVPVHQTSYLDESDREVYEALIKIADENHVMPEEAFYHLLSTKEIKDMFSDYPEVFKGLSHLVKSIDFTLNLPSFDMPVFPNDKGVSSKVYLRSLSEVGLKKRLKQGKIKDSKPYIERLDFELSVIESMHYEDYFLIVYDFVKYAKTHDILVGPGRGSAAGSLVSYALGITDVDPIFYQLLFERFLNPERLSMPDIDLDFPDDKRDEVIAYVLKKYGQRHMVSIVTFGTFAMRSSIRDIARVMKIDLARVNGIIERVLNDRIDETDQEMVRLLRVAKQIEGLPRHTGTHAAGMILSAQDLTKHIPLHMGGHAFYQSQFEAKDLESLGLLKIDFLGIRNLKIIHDVVSFIKKKTPTFDLRQIPLDDAKSYQLLSSAQTHGLFQLESQGMRNVLRKLKPKTFEDIVAILALYRPGPMENIDVYIKRRAGAQYEDIDPLLTPILAPTYGIIVYQEQIMKIAQVFAGYTLAQADLLRRGISKKDHDILEKERANFIKSAVLINRDQARADTIYQYIVRFADYGFNRSHSVAYGMIAYQMAYLKANHFDIFMVALLNSIIGNESLTQDYYQELKNNHVMLLPPDINASTDQYLYTQKGILMPLLSVKSIGRPTVSKILEVRKEGLFKDFLDFKLRIKKEINERNIEMLIHSGALDTFGLNHKTMIENKDIDFAGYELYVKDFKLRNYKDYDIILKGEFEKEALGFNLVYHLLSAYEKEIEKQHLKTIKEALLSDQAIDVIGYIKKIKKINTKSGKDMAFITIDDGNDTLDITLFHETLRRFETLFSKDVMVFNIRKNMFNQKTTFVLNDLRLLETNA